MRHSGRNGQTTLELAILIAVVAAAALGMQIYLKRGIGGRLRQAADSIGPPYLLGQTTANETTNITTVSRETLIEEQPPPTPDGGDSNQQGGGANKSDDDPCQQQPPPLGCDPLGTENPSPTFLSTAQIDTRTEHTINETVEIDPNGALFE